MYRSYVIWDRNRLAVSLPLATSLAFIGVAIVGNLSCVSSVTISPAVMHNIVVAYYSFPVASNAACTIAICGKIFWHHHTMRHNKIKSQANYVFMMSVMAESGVFYAIAGIINIVFVVKDHPLQQVTSAVFTSLVYITPAQIILRIALGVDLKSWLAQDQSVKDSSIVFATRHLDPINPWHTATRQSHIISIPAETSSTPNIAAMGDSCAGGIRQVTITEVFRDPPDSCPKGKRDKRRYL